MEFRLSDVDGHYFSEENKVITCESDESDSEEMKEQKDRVTAFMNYWYKHKQNEHIICKRAFEVLLYGQTIARLELPSEIPSEKP